MHGVGGSVYKALNAGGSGTPCNCRGAKEIDGALDLHIGNGKNSVIQSCGDTHTKNASQYGFVYAQFPNIQMESAFLAHKVTDD